jgi:tetratricopeptide (TPR) repeat protein
MAAPNHSDGYPDHIQPGQKDSSAIRRYEQRFDTGVNTGVTLGIADNATVIGNFPNQIIVCIVIGPVLMVLGKQTNNNYTGAMIVHIWDKEEKKEAAQIKVSEVSQSSLDNIKPETLEAAWFVAEKLETLGDYKLALEYYNETFEARKKTRGNADSWTLKAACRVARNLESQGRYEAALKWYDRVFEIRRKSLGDKDPETLEAASGVARVLERQGRHEAAQTWYNAVLKMSGENSTRT